MGRTLRPLQEMTAVIMRFLAQQQSQVPAQPGAVPAIQIYSPSKVGPINTLLLALCRWTSSHALRVCDD